MHPPRSADGISGGTDDVVLGTTKATLVFTTIFDGSLPGRYEWLFDTPITGNIDGFKSNCRVRLESLEADSGGLTYNMRFKTTSGTAASAVKMDIAGSSTSNGLIDNDNDGIHDAFETNTGVYVGPANTGTNPNTRDRDNDRLSVGFEVANGFDPFANADFDDDGFSDALEIVFYNSDLKLNTSSPGVGA